jgi:hypothetical protein
VKRRISCVQSSQQSGSEIQIMAQLLPAIDGTVFATPHIFRGATCQTAVFGIAFRKGQAFFIIGFHWSIM